MLQNLSPVNHCDCAAPIRSPRSWANGFFKNRGSSCKRSLSLLPQISRGQFAENRFESLLSNRNACYAGYAPLDLTNGNPYKKRFVSRPMKSPGSKVDSGSGKRNVFRKVNSMYQRFFSPLRDSPFFRSFHGEKITLGIHGKVGAVVWRR